MVFSIYIEIVGGDLDAGHYTTVEDEIGDKDGSISFGDDQNKVDFNIDGLIGNSSSFTIGDTTYTYKAEFGVDKIAFEESVSKKFESGSMTSTIGVKKSNHSKWVSVPVYEPETVLIEIPQMQMPDSNWDDVMIGGGVIFVTGLIFVIPTGGASLSLCLV